MPSLNGFARTTSRYDQPSLVAEAAKVILRIGTLIRIPEMASTVSIEETESMIDMLDWFAAEPCDCATVGQIADEIGVSRQTVRNNLKQLMAGGHAERRHESTGVYRLLDDPREDD